MLVGGACMEWKPDVRRRFERLFTTDKDRSRGLKLALSKKIVDLLNDTICAQSSNAEKR